MRKPAELAAPDGTRIAIEVGDDYAGLSTTGLVPFTARFQVYAPGASQPRIDITSSLAFIHASNGMLQASGRGQDGKHYHLHAEFPQVGLESFDFARPVYAGVEQVRTVLPDRVVAESHPGDLEKMGEVGSRSVLRRVAVPVVGGSTIAGTVALLAKGHHFLALGALAVGVPLMLLSMDV